eukprot:5677063-Prymnesium_polylepis.1
MQAFVETALSFAASAEIELFVHQGIYSAQWQPMLAHLSATANISAVTSNSSHCEQPNEQYPNQSTLCRASHALRVYVY